MTTEALLTTDDTTLLDDSDLFIKPQKKYKVLMLSDHPLAPSGVGVQARFLIEGLIKTGRWSFRCLGGAIKHQNYDTIGVNADFVVKPVDGFGSKEMIRNLLITEKPDAIFLFTDPRQFIWIWEMEDEIKQICPIVYWHVWDNDPYPQFNFPWYEGTELINCLSYKTYEMLKERFPEKTNYIPHAFPKGVYGPIPEDQTKQLRVQNFGPRADWFQVLWVNRNATRKMPGDLLFAWKTFLEDLEAKHGHRNATLIMHTDPNDPEGPNLMAISDQLGLAGNVWFSAEKLQFEQMNVMHNITDTCINIAKNEGFGLSTMISMMCGKPIIALKTGGMTRQVVDHRDGSEHGVGIEPCKRSLVGSQLVPYIFEDFCTEQQVSDALMKVFEMTPHQKKVMKQKVIDYCDYEFKFENMVNSWDKTMFDTIENFKAEKASGKPTWKLLPLNPTLPKVVDAREEDVRSGPVPAPVPQVKINDKAIRGGLKATKLERKPKSEIQVQETK
ncbi:MAG: glycosyltransferase [Candidatus Paceibacterota bacterium]|jgi:glycosyltransferase involved in cell wall biosynthesis